MNFHNTEWSLIHVIVVVRKKVPGNRRGSSVPAHVAPVCRECSSLLSLCIATELPHASVLLSSPTQGR